MNYVCILEEDGTRHASELLSLQVYSSTSISTSFILFRGVRTCAWLHSFSVYTYTNVPLVLSFDKEESTIIKK
jgi:hypothetical protein